MRKMLILSAMIFSFSFIHTQQRESRLYKDAVSLGMGGVGVSTIGYSFSPIYNPAALGLMADHDIAPFLTLGTSINLEAISVFKQLSSTKDITSIDYDSLAGKAPTIGINGPLNAGYMGKGFGIWTTTSADASFAFIQNPNSIFAKNGVNVSMNNLAAAGKEYLDYGGNANEDQIRDIFEKYLEDDLQKAGLTEEEIRKAIDYIAKNPDAIKDLLPKAKLDATAEITVNLAYGYRVPFAFIDEVSGLSFGATVRFSQRFKMTSGDEFKPVDGIMDSFGDITSNIYQAGSISSDFGTALRIENWIFGLSVRDAFSSGYRWKNLDGVSGGIKDSKIPLSLDFGNSYRFYFNNKFIQEVGLYLEFEDTLNEYTSWANKMRLGSEVRLFNFLNLRVGMYDSFVTGGIGVSWKWFKMDFAYYRESYFDIFTSDQFYLNMTVGLDNSPQRKERSLQKQLQQDRVQAQALDLIDNSLQGI